VCSSDLDNNWNWLIFLGVVALTVTL
jgi:hypothetical protein